MDAPRPVDQDRKLFQSNEQGEEAAAERETAESRLRLRSRSVSSMSEVATDEERKKQTEAKPPAAFEPITQQDARNGFHELEPKDEPANAVTKRQAQRLRDLDTRESKQAREQNERTEDAIRQHTAETTKDGYDVPAIHGLRWSAISSAEAINWCLSLCRCEETTSSCKNQRTNNCSKRMCARRSECESLRMDRNHDKGSNFLGKPKSRQTSGEIPLLTRCMFEKCQRRLSQHCAGRFVCKLHYARALVDDNCKSLFLS